MKRLKVLSIDLDYFFPDPSWFDWSHSEESALLYEMVWATRPGTPAAGREDGGPDRRRVRGDVPEDARVERPGQVTRRPDQAIGGKNMTTTEPKIALKPAKLILEHDSDVENPCAQEEGRGWVVHSFNRRHTNFKDPSEFLNRDGSGVNIGIQRRLDCGTAFLLSCYEHSGCAWSLKGERQQCQWDTTQYAGIMIWQGKAKDAGKTVKEREERARKAISVYTDWANGTCYYYRLEDLAGEEIDACGGYIGDKDLETAVLEAIKEHEVEVTEVEGDAKWLWKYIQPAKPKA